MIKTTDLANMARGMLMGGADIVPGVSGGTVALILGIYSRLVTALSRFDRPLLKLLGERQWKSAAEHIDLRFLMTLGMGILFGIGSLASLMHYLLENPAQVTIRSINKEEGFVNLNFTAHSNQALIGTRCLILRQKNETEYRQLGEIEIITVTTLKKDNITSSGRAKPLGKLSIDELRHDDAVIIPNHRRMPTLAMFFGLILASSLLVSKMVPRWSIQSAAGFLGGCLFAYWLVGQTPTASIDDIWYFFLCGMLGICAMILPGISGAFILLLLGVYTDVTGLLRDLLHGNWTFHVWGSVIVFVSGCVVGLLIFSKFLSWLLKSHGGLTMAVLCGFMLGSLRKIWPFKMDMTPHIADFKAKHLVNILPQQWDGLTWLSLGCLLAGIGIVFLLDKLTKRIDLKTP